MTPTIRGIGIANGGGDCPGLNAVIRGVVRSAILGHGWRVVGILDGFDGLIWPERSIPLTVESIAGILPRGGTILGSRSKGDPFHHTSEGESKVTHGDYLTCRKNMDHLGIDAMVVIGGDGTQTIARDLGRLGLPVVGVPKTIDNDLSATEVTFGFDTALHVATDAIDRLHTTGESHGRVMVIEVMGRDAGWIALHSGIAGGADVILIPEIPFTIETVCERLRERAATGKKFSIVVVAEGVKLPPNDPFGQLFPKPRPGQVGILVAESGCAHHCARTHSARRFAQSFRPHFVHAIRSGSRRACRARRIRPHGLPSSWRNTVSPSRRCRRRGPFGRSKRKHGARRARRRNYFRRSRINVSTLHPYLKEKFARFISGPMNRTKSDHRRSPDSAR
jgi:6-phosphofructokinase